ncbi:MAG: hypothetical protein VX223_08990, partial [Myxococcota bacterium]|nr:hypothetical protein [Myxococcota bacterium]
MSRPYVSLTTCGSLIGLLLATAISLGCSSADSADTGFAGITGIGTGTDATDESTESDGQALASCEPLGGTRCVGNTVQTCTDAGWEVTVSCSSNGQLCEDGACIGTPSTAEGCEDNTCPPGSYCASDGSKCLNSCVGIVCGPSPVNGYNCGSCPSGTTCAPDGTECQAESAGLDASDGTDGADSTASFDTTDATDNADATDAMDGSDATDAIDGFDANDGDDGTEPPFNQCLNSADLALAAQYDLNSEATTCYLGCLADSDPIMCANICLKNNTGISDGCGGCYTEKTFCTFDNCLAQCATDPNSDECSQCQISNGCASNFYQCVGVAGEPIDDGSQGTGGGSSTTTCSAGTTCEQGYCCTCAGIGCYGGLDNEWSQLSSLANGPIQEALDDGELHILIELNPPTSINFHNATLSSLCDYVQSTCSWYVWASTFNALCEPKSSITSFSSPDGINFSAGDVGAGPAVPLAIPIFPYISNSEINLRHATIQGTWA